MIPCLPLKCLFFRWASLRMSCLFVSKVVTEFFYCNEQEFKSKSHTHTHTFFLKWLSIFFFPVAILRGSSCVRIIIPESLTTVAGRLKRGYGSFCFMSVLNSEALTARRILHRRSPQTEFWTQRNLTHFGRGGPEIPLYLVNSWDRANKLCKCRPRVGSG